jgi:RecA-family ATPase
VSDLVKVNYAAFKVQADKLKDAIAVFEPFVTSFTQNAKVENANADFINSFNKLMSNMSDDVAPELLADIKEYSQKVDALAAKFEQADETLASAYMGG